ncbi:hypothetical protein Tco_0443372 [Tanacetum coccineum]
MNDEIHKPNPNPKPIHTFTSTNHIEPQPVKPSFASVIHNKPKLSGDHSSSNHVRTVILNDRDLICVNDSSTVILLKLKVVDSMSNMYMICRNKGFSDVKIHHVGSWSINITVGSLDTSSKTYVNDIDKVADSVE